MRAEDGRSGLTRTRRSESHNAALAPFASAVGRTRFVVLLAVAAVMLVSTALFVLGTVMAVASVWHAFEAVLRGDLGSADLTVEFLEIVSVMLKAVVFYIVGVGFYSLFIAPLNVTAALGVQTFSDLETKIVSVIIVILSITFLERFIAWQQPVDTMLFGLTLAVVIAALVLFQFQSHRSREKTRDDPESQERAQHQLFEEGEEQHEVKPERPGDRRDEAAEVRR
jgi:uncharacterized membrane protein YqhA